MAISQVGSAVSFTSNGAGITSVSLTVPSGAALLRVGLGIGHYASFSVSAVALNGVALTQIPGSTHIIGTYYSTDQWYLVNPPAGTYDLTIAGEGSDCVVGCDFWAGCDTTTPFGTAAVAWNAASQNPEVTIADYAAGDVALGVCVSTANYGTPKTDNTEQWYLTSLGVSTDRCEGSYSTSTGLLSWNTQAVGIWCATGVALKPAPSHTSTGALAGQGAAVAGTAARTASGVTITSISATTDGTNLIVSFHTSVDVSTGVAGFGYSIGSGEPITWWVDEPGAANNQYLSIPLAELGIVAGGVVNIDAGYSLTSPAGTIVYASSESTPLTTITVGVGAHYTSGDLVAGGATLAGTANRIAAHTSTSALVADGAIIAGTATLIKSHTSSGALAAGGAIVFGVATPPGVSSTTANWPSVRSVIKGLQADSLSE